MEISEKSSLRSEDKLADTVSLNWKDKLKITIQSALQISPFGAVIGTAVFETMAARQVKRLEQLTQSLVEELSKHSEKIDQAYFDTDEFQTIFRKSYEAAAREHQQLKLEAIKNLLARNTIEARCESFDLDAWVLVIITSLTVPHIQCMMELTKQVQEGTPRGKASGFHVPEYVAKKVGVDPVIARALLAHLKYLGLVEGEAGMGMVGRAMVSADVSYGLSRTGSIVLGRILDLSSSPHQ